MNSSSVFTGRIDGQGNIIALNDEQVALKVKTIFFSPYCALVIPKANEQTAQATLDELHNKYEVQKLEIVPVKNLRDVFNNRIAIETQYRNVGQRAVMKAKRHPPG